MKKWRIQFRYIPPYDYTTPMMYIPLEATIVEAENAEEAQEKMFRSFRYSPREHYRIEKIEDLE